jgi:CheY-specific phosphatase CheX
MNQLIPWFDQMLLSATEQAFSLILFTEVSLRPEPIVLEAATPAVHATIRLVSDSEHVQIGLILRCARADAMQMAARMLQISRNEADNTHMIGDVMGEVINMIGGGLKTAIEEDSTDFVLGLPDVQEKPTGALSPLPEHASVLHFSDGEDLQFSIALIKEVSCARTRYR